LVTGASTGIGFATAIRLAKSGSTVYAGARRMDKMEPLKAHGINIVALDVTDEDSMSAAVAGVTAAHGRIEVLVNNAGYGSYGSLEEVEPAEGRRQFDVNVFGLARMTQLVIPGMRAAGRGRIINVSSMGGKMYEPLGAWYHATKFAVEGLSDSLRMELRAGLSTPPEAVADAIVHAATAARPRTRYPVGSSARALLLLRRLLPDRVFDGVIWAIYKRFPG
jgi:short-subunit dehydrogenase